MGSFYMEATQINYRRDDTFKTVDQKLQELSETSAIDTDIAPVFKSTNTYAPGDMVYYRNKLYVFNVEHTGAWAAGDVSATDVTTELSSLKSVINEVNSKFYNNTYTADNDYNLNIVISGSVVSVMGYVMGTETNEYCGVSLPIPYASDYTAVVFSARNQNTGDFIQLRCGGAANNFKIYRTSSMTTGVPYAFSFSYNKATVI